MKSGSCYENYFSYQRQCTCKKNSMYVLCYSFESWRNNFIFQRPKNG